MKKLSAVRFLFSIFLLVICTSIFAASNSSDLATMLNAVHSMKANFTQTVYDNRGKRIQTSYGRMAMQRPGKFRWEVTKPIPQLIIANGSRLWIYDPDLQQVTIRSLKRATGETPALLLSHVDNVLDQDYAIKEAEKNKPGWRWFTLIPREADSMFASIQMGFMNNQIREMRLQDHLGHATLIRFADAQTNLSLSGGLFVFRRAANVDVIDETRKK